MPDFASLHSLPNSPLAIIATPGAEELTKLIDKRLMTFFKGDGVYEYLDKKLLKLFESYNIESGLKAGTFVLDSACPRFTNGDAKGIINETVRGRDLYIICDPGNHDVTYKIMGKDVPMSPDDHFANLKRIIAACNGKPAKITVIMPMLYGGRQHRRNARESLDCATMLQELQAMGVTDLITFDAHDPRVQNAVPLMGFDNYFPHYQVLKALTKKFDDIKLDKDNLMVVSPDEGAMTRNVFYASILGLDLGMFYKRRDYTTIVNGRNPIVAHEYIGSPVEGKDVFVADDMIATGDSILKLARDLKAKGARKVILAATFSLFTEGVEKFDKAYEEGAFDLVISTNLTFRPRELDTRDWYVAADMSKYITYIITAAHFNSTVSTLLDPSAKISELVKKYTK